MDGLQALAIIMRDMPVPVVMLSSLTAEGAPATISAPGAGCGRLRAEAGAARGGRQPYRGAAGARAARRGAGQVQPLRTAAVEAAASGSRPAPGPLPARPRRIEAGVPADRVLAIGCSTGGPRALAELVAHLPANLPAVLIVQHMPAGFTRSLPSGWIRLSPLAVREAEHGDVAAAGQVLVAPGGKHLTVNARGVVELNEARASTGCGRRWMCSSARLPGFGPRIVAAVLTGMGSDGAEGASLIRAAGGRVVAEDASTAVVYGMLRAVAERGVAERQLPLGEVAACVTRLVVDAAARARRSGRQAESQMVSEFGSATRC